MLTLCWFPVNAAWCFVFHKGNPVDGTPITLGDWPRFWTNSADAIAAAKSQGLVRTRDVALNFTSTELVPC